jgi:hypothetical protein
MMRSAPHEQRACSPRTDAAYYGQKNKPTTFRKSWLGLNISSRPLFMRSAPHYYCSDDKGRDKNLNVQGICEEFSEKHKKSIITNTFVAKNLRISIIFTTFALSNKSSLI